MIGERLKKIRITLKLSQLEFAEKLNTQQRNISRYETNQSDFPDELKIKLSEMGINLNWLLTGEGLMFKDKQIDIQKDIMTDSRIRELEKKIDELKKSIADLENENKNLEAKNKELSEELLEKFRELVNTQKKYDELKLNHS
jgi:transcriptional regulator with XRE-family HTH domain